MNYNDVCRTPTATHGQLNITHILILASAIFYVFIDQYNNNELSDRP